MKKVLVFAVFTVLLGVLTMQATAAGLLDFNEPYQVAAVWAKADRSLVRNAVAGLPSEYQAFQLDAAGLASVLAEAPPESKVALRDSQTLLELPMPDGKLAEFRIQDAPVLMPELQARFPEIRTYRVVGVKDGTITGRLDFSPYGFHATLSGGDAGTVTILPADASNPGLYAVYRGTNPDAEEIREMCGSFERTGKVERVADDRFQPNIALGPQIRTYRIAISATWEYANAFGNGTVAGTVASIATWLNAVNVYFERDVAVRLLLVNNTNIIYSTDRGFTAATDPFDNESAQNQLLAQNATVLRDQVGVANYNLGHVLALSNNGGNGVAYIQAVCNDQLVDGGPMKGGAFSRLSVPAGNSVGVSIFTHEIGHQFGAEHTHNAAGCAGLSPENGYEAGGGSSLMAYRGNCGLNAYGPPFGAGQYFHGRSIQQMTNHIVNGVGASCAVLVNSGNNAPTVTAPATVNIPKQTPFALTATANDPDAGDNNNLTYAWEQFDAGGAFSNPSFSDAGDPPNTTRPIFRSLFPTRESTRFFPSLNYILNNANDPPEDIPVLIPGNAPFQRKSAEKLPQVTRTLNFRVTVRDNVGGTNDASTVVNVDGNSGPFRVTAPNTAATLAGGSQQNITWDVANTRNAPVSAANVRITLSTDGGNTFPTVLAASVPNTGTAAVTIPNGVATTTARVKIEAVGNIFFDVSDVNFTITLGGTCPAISSIAPVAATPGQPVVITGRNFTGVSGVRFANNQTATFVVDSDTQITATVPAGAVGGTVAVVKPGCGDTTTAPLTICAAAPITLQIDNGGAGNSGGGGVSGVPMTNYVVNRLTPASYPATITAVTVVLPPANFLPTTAVVRVLAGASNNGQDIDNTVLQSVPVTLPAGRDNPVTFPITPFTITAGDFVVGYSWDVPANASYFGVTNDSAASQDRSYMGFDGTSWTRMRRNFMIRAQVQLNCSSVGGCGLTLGSTTQNVAATGGTGTVNFTTTANDCPWTVTRAVSWISITSAANGNGPGAVTFTVAPNNTTAPRTGTFSVGGQTFTVTQAAGTEQNCNYAIAPAAANVATTASAGNTFAVTAPTGCGWQASTTDAWITVNSTGNGNGNVTYSVAANPGATPRTGRINVGGQLFTVTQAGSAPTCNYAIAPAEANVGATAATGLTFAVTAPNGCAWTATTTDAWITITGGANGNGNGNVTYSVAANPSQTVTRTGTIVAGGQAFRVLQAPATPNCAFAINGTELNAPATASTANNFAVTTAAGCAWTATWNAPWITVTAGAGTGNGTVTFNVDANPDAVNARNGTITVGGQTFTVRQAAATAQCVPITGGLVNWYRGEVNPNDSVGANNGVPAGNIGYLDPGRIGSSIAFDGASSITIGRSVADDLSIEFWFLTAQPGGASETDWTQGAGLVANDEFGVTLGNGKVMFGVGGSTIASANTLNDAQWHHIVATRERASGLLRLFVDGVVQAATVNAGTDALTAGAQLVMGRRGGGGIFFNGQLDEVKIYGATLRNEQVTAAFTGCNTQPRVNVDNPAVREGDPNPNGEFSSVAFTVRLSSASTQDVTIQYVTDDDTAVEGVDYVGRAGTLVIPAGSTSGVVTVPIIADNTDEPDRAFDLILRLADNAVISDGEGVATILDDDSSCDFALGDDVFDFAAVGGNGSLTIDGNSGCGWSAAAADPWITIANGANGSGDGTVNFSVAANSGAARTGRIVVAGQLVTINQAAPLAPSVTIGGRVVAGKSGVPNATVTLTGAGGPRSVKTNSFGAYSFTAVPTGQTVTVSAKAKGLSFTPRTLSVTNAVSDFDLLSAPN